MPKFEESRPIIEMGKEATSGEVLTLLNADLLELQEIIDGLPKTEMAPNDDFKKWMSAISLATRCLVKGAVYRSTLDREDADWKQHVQHGDSVIASSGLTPKSGSGNVSGEAAMLKIKSMMGLGTVIQVPLWHTGIWVTLKAPGDAAILELNRRIASEKITLGRTTHAMAFSNKSIYIKGLLVNFILHHVYDCSLKDYSPEKLKDVIKVTDIPLLVWGILCTMYPKGTRLEEPCVADPLNCTHVNKGVVNVARMLWVDNDRLSEKQRNHMLKRRKDVTDVELEAYWAEHKFFSREVAVGPNKDVRFILDVPTISQYEVAGYSWVDGIVKMVEQSFAQDLRARERDAYISDQGALAALRQYSHWFTTILMGDGEDPQVINDRDTIDAICSDLSSDIDARDHLLAEVGKYIDEVTVALIGYPNTPCPACGGVVKDKSGESTAIIPVEIEQVFFTLTRQRLQKRVKEPALI